MKNITKTVVNAITAISTVVAIGSVAFIYPKVTEMIDISTTYQNTKNRYDNSKRSAITAENDFVSNRDFELYYNDVDGILELLNNVSGITVSEVLQLDATNGFAEIGVYEKGTDVNALRITLVVNNIDIALQSIEKAQFAISNIECISPNKIIIDIITKGVS